MNGRFATFRDTGGALGAVGAAGWDGVGRQSVASSTSARPAAAVLAKPDELKMCILLHPPMKRAHCKGDEPAAVWRFGAIPCRSMASLRHNGAARGNPP